MTSRPPAEKMSSRATRSVMSACLCWAVAAPVFAEATRSAIGPRFFVPDFLPGDEDKESPWVAVAVSEGLRYRLIRSGISTAVSEMRTSAVMSRLAADPEQVNRVAQLLGADHVVMGAISRTDKGYAAKIVLGLISPPGPNQSRAVQGTNVRGLLNACTEAVFSMSGVQLTEAQQRKAFSGPGGTDSAVEYYAKAIRALRAGKPSDSLHYVGESVRYDNNFRPTMKLLGQMNLAAGNEAEVLAIFERLLRQAKLDEDPVDELFALIQIGMCHQRRGDLRSAERYFQSALDSTRQLGLADQQALALGALANLRVDQRRREDALTLLKQRLQLLETEGDQLATGPACLTVALVYAAKGQYAESLEFLSRAVKLADASGMKTDKALALFQTGEIYLEQKKFEEALAAYQASLELTEENEKGSAYRQIAEIYEKQSKFDDALKMLRQAESTLAKRKAYAQQANCLARISRIQLKKGAADQAVETMTEAVDILRDLRHPDLPAYEKELAEMKKGAGK